MNPIALPVAELKPALTGLAKLIHRPCAFPALNHIKIERGKDGWVALTATDLDQFVTVRLEQPDDGDPVTLLAPYEELLKITRHCPKSDTLLLRAGNDNAVSIQFAIGNEVAEAKVESLPAAEFPEIPRIQGELIAVSDALRMSIHNAMECASSDETRLILNGAFVDVSGDCQCVVGTDGRHLFSGNSFRLPLKESLLIPNHKFLGWKEFNNDGEWQLKVGPKETDDDPPPFQISSRRWSFIGRQIPGNYPNWRQVIPDSGNVQATLEFDPDGLEKVIRIIQRMPCGDPLNFAIGLECCGGKLRMLGKSANAENWTRVEIPGAKAAGADVTIFLNRHFLAKALQFRLSGAEIFDAASPMRFTALGRQMIVVPIRPSGSTETHRIPAPSKPLAPEPEARAHSTNPAPDPTAAIPAAQNERKPMSDPNNETPRPATPLEEKPALETAIAQLDGIRGDFRNLVAGLGKLGEQLKAAAREQKAGEKEVQSVRQTLRSLQSVRL